MSVPEGGKKNDHLSLTYSILATHRSTPTLTFSEFRYYPKHPLATHTAVTIILQALPTFSYPFPLQTVPAERSVLHVARQALHGGAAGLRDQDRRGLEIFWPQLLALNFYPPLGVLADMQPPLPGEG